jgi:hypothetical protein
MEYLIFNILAVILICGGIQLALFLCRLIDECNAHWGIKVITWFLITVGVIAPATYNGLSRCPSGLVAATLLSYTTLNGLLALWFSYRRTKRLDKEFADYCKTAHAEFKRRYPETNC